MSIFTILFLAIIFFLFLAGGLGYFITQMSAIAVDQGALGGIEGFIIGNWIFFIIMGFAIAIIWWAMGRGG